MDLAFKLLALLFTATSLSFSIAAFIHSRRREKQNDNEELENQIAALSADVLVLKKQVEVFWKGVGFTAAQALHSPHTPELDRLLEKLQRDEINTPSEWVRLKELLEEVKTSDPNECRTKWASDLLVLIEVKEVGERTMTELERAGRASRDRVRSRAETLEGLLL